MNSVFDSYAAIEELKSIFPDIYSGQGSNSFCIAFVRDQQSLDMIRKPFSFSGFMTFYCIEGRAGIRVDRHEYDLQGGRSVIVFPGAVVNVCDEDLPARYHLVVIAMSIDAIDQLPVDIKNVMHPEILLNRRAVVSFDAETERVVRTQISLANTMSHIDTPFADDISRSMFSVVFFILMSLVSKQGHDALRDNNAKTLLLESRFIRLLKDNYREHREISFYADSLGVSANYLSRRLKSSSGFNASQWIDSFLLPEAKNLLLMTTKPVSEISDHLHFSGQAAFSKYFKEKTGMTPSEFRRR